MLRWECEKKDVIHAIMIAELKPSIRLFGDLYPWIWELESDGEYFASEYFSGDSDHPQSSITPKSWLYLQDPVQIAAFDCEFNFVSEDRNPLKAEVPVSKWFKLPKKMVMEDVKEQCIFLLKEVEDCESKHGKAQAISKIDTLLGTRERNTLLNIIAILCKEAKLDPTTTSKTAEHIVATGDKMGVNIGQTTVRDVLKKIPDALRTRMK